MQITIQHGGESLPVQVNGLADLKTPSVANLVGYDPNNVEFTVNGSVVSEIHDGDTVFVRTRAGGKA